jgi:peptidoglycan/xylan/chitin deacetylase (PgdA/CDA1 family)
MQSYGIVDEDKLSDKYWLRVKEKIEKYGEAKRIATFEYHDDSYDMYDGAYSMTPEYFSQQMRYFMANDYHFVTGPELVGYLNGWLSLPAKSIILTSDSGYDSIESLSRLNTLFDQLKKEYGYAPHLFSFVWIKNMSPEENPVCNGNRCWNTYKKALESGYFTIGSHSSTHQDFTKTPEEQGLQDWINSKRLIKENLGVEVYGLAWPYEIYPQWANKLKESGFLFGFGGNSRGNEKNFVYSLDPLIFNLPRLFPTNPSGITSRPSGLTLDDLLSKMKDESVPIKTTMQNSPHEPEVTANPGGTIDLGYQYQELSHDQEIVIPSEIVVHWAGGGSSAKDVIVGLNEIKERDELVLDKNGLVEKLEKKTRSTNAHFVIGLDGTVIQTLPIYERGVTSSKGSLGYPNVINIELAGAPDNFQQGEVSQKQLESITALIKQLMKIYSLDIGGIQPHSERDKLYFSNGTVKDRGKPDPGIYFMGVLKQKLAETLGLNNT